MANKRGSSGHHHRSNVSKVKKGQKKANNNKNSQNKIANNVKTTKGQKQVGAADDSNIPKWERKLLKKNQQKQKLNNKQLTVAASHASIGLQGDQEILVNAVNPPKIVAIVAFHDLANPYLLKRKCLAMCGSQDAEDETKVLPYQPYTVKLPDWARSGKSGEESTTEIINNDGHYE
jgi:hypothetical protein